MAAIFGTSALLAAALAVVVGVHPSGAVVWIATVGFLALMVADLAGGI